MADAVIFDLGITLASAPRLQLALAHRLGVTAAKMAAVYDEGRYDWDAGGADEDYWGPLVEKLGHQRDAALIAELVALDVAHWSVLRDSAWQLVRDCRAAGHRVVLLSNAPHAMQRTIDASPWRADFDEVFVSSTIGFMKPDPSCYALVAEQLGSDLVFIDDRQPNVDGALASGWRAHLWVDDADSRAWLISQGILAR